tara:strand:+ start:2224 stop:4662 length:2439 start_codon:yes stop_codon:yes gene_type:complete
MASYLDPVTTLSGVEDPFAARMRRDFLESAFDLAATPTPIAQQQIAGFDPLEQQARQLAGGLGQFQPFIQQAAGFYGPQGARDFYNPYEDAVVQQTISDLSERSGIQGIADRASAVQAGAFGGSRGRLMESERQRALGRGLAEAIGGIRQRGFEGARAAAQGAASGLAGLAQTGQAGLINQIGTLGQLGGLGRGLQQAGFDATFDAAQRAALEPRQRLQTLQGMLSLLPRTRASTVFRAAAGTDPTAQALGFLRGGGLQGLLGMEEGGFVGAGGKEYPNKGLAALSKSAPEVVERMGYERGGEVFPAEEALNFIEGTGPMGVPYPSGMPAQVFEEGDPEINEALNRMAAAVKPTGEAPKVEVEEAPEVIATELAEVEEKIKEPRGKEGIFLKDVEEQRESLENAIVTFVEQKNIQEEPPLKVKKEIESFIDKANTLFKKTVQNSADKLDVDINIDQVTLLTDKFDRKLETTFPVISDIMESDDSGTTDQEPLMMEHGGIVNAAAIAELEKQLAEVQEKQKQETNKRRADRYNAQITNLKTQIAELKHPPVGGKQERPGLPDKVENEMQKDADVAAAAGAFDEFGPSALSEEEYKKQLEEAEKALKDGAITKEAYDALVANDPSKKKKEEEPLPTFNLPGLTAEEKLLPYYERLKEYEDKMINAGLMSGKSKEGGLAGAFDVIGQARAKAVPVGMSPDAALIQALSRGIGPERVIDTSLSASDQARIRVLATQNIDRAIEEGVIPTPATGFTPEMRDGLIRKEMERIIEENKAVFTQTAAVDTSGDKSSITDTLGKLVTDAGKNALRDALNLT